jgi:hypothetical protein
MEGIMIERLIYKHYPAIRLYAFILSIILVLFYYCFYRGWFSFDLLWVGKFVKVDMNDLTTLTERAVANRVMLSLTIANGFFIIDNIDIVLPILNKYHVFNNRFAIIILALLMSFFYNTAFIDAIPVFTFTIVFYMPLYVIQLLIVTLRNRYV